MAAKKTKQKKPPPSATGYLPGPGRHRPGKNSPAARTASNNNVTAKTSAKAISGLSGQQTNRSLASGSAACQADRFRRRPQTISDGLRRLESQELSDSRTGHAGPACLGRRGSPTAPVALIAPTLAAQRFECSSVKGAAPPSRRLSFCAYPRPSFLRVRLPVADRDTAGPLGVPRREAGGEAAPDPQPGAVPCA